MCFALQNLYDFCNIYVPPNHLYLQYKSFSKDILAIDNETLPIQHLEFLDQITF